MIALFRDVDGVIFLSIPVVTVLDSAFQFFVRSRYLSIPVVTVQDSAF
jgi:hypothetical protein